MGRGGALGKGGALGNGGALGKGGALGRGGVLGMVKEWEWEGHLIGEGHWRGRDREKGSLHHSST